MIRRHALILLAAPLLLAVLTAATFRAAGADMQDPLPPRERTVVLVSLDGFPRVAFDDPALPIPNLRRLVADGTIAAGLRPANPVVTWPNHTSFVTGVTAARHHVLYNGLIVHPGEGRPPRVEPWRDKQEMVRATTVYDLAHKQGLTTAQVDWVAIQNPGTITWAFPERPDPQGAVEQEMVKAGILSQEDLEQFGSRPVLWRDHIWTKAAIHIIRTHRPNLLLFHLLNTDSTQHRYGPSTPAAATALAHADMHLGWLIGAIEAAGLRDRTTILVVSDHGFKTVRRHVRPNVLLRHEGLLTGSGQTITGDAYVLSQAGIAQVYLTRQEGRGALFERVKALFGGVEGIARVIEPPEYAAIGLPSPSESDQVGALVLAAADGYAFSSAAEGEIVSDAEVGGLGSHGYLNTDPEMRALFVASGHGIRRGAGVGLIDAPDVGAIVASLLGVDLGEIDGRVPEGLLEPAPGSSSAGR